jgi:hypothetical protein
MSLLEGASLRHLAREQDELADPLEEILLTDPQELSLSLILELLGAEGQHLLALHLLLVAHLGLLDAQLSLRHDLLELFGSYPVFATRKSSRLEHLLYFFLQDHKSLSLLYDNVLRKVFDSGVEQAQNSLLAGSIDLYLVAQCIIELV